MIGYHASHEQFAPSELVALAQMAEEARFASIMSSDHFHPWSNSQGQSGFGWAWLGAAMQATTLPFGTLCIPGGWRYHPAIVAQAAATLADMFPDRLAWLAAGSGEALNEHVVGQGWPEKNERNLRLRSAVEIMRALWRGEEVNSDGPIPTRNARLYTRPPGGIDIIAPALTAETARWAGSWADGLVTVNAPREKLREILRAFREGGGRGKPAYLQVHLAWAASDEEARTAAWQQWRFNCVDPKLAAELESPEDFEAASADLASDQLENSIRISADPQRHSTWIEEDMAMGFDAVFLHQVGRDQASFIEVFGREVIPRFR